jgi:uncharacterized protein DUF4386/MFS transporter
VPTAIIFVAASAICAAAPTLPVLIAARILHGTRAALITPASLALIREAFIDRAARGRAIAYEALGGSVAAAAGPVLGGAFTELDWQLIFLVNLPIGVAAFPIRARLAGSPRRIVPFNRAGQIAAVADLAGLTYGIMAPQAASAATRCSSRRRSAAAQQRCRSGEGPGNGGNAAFNDIWYVGQFLFGLHLLLIGYLPYRSGYVPKLLGALIAISGLGYAADSLGAVLSPGRWTDISGFTFIGEFLLALK